MSTRFLSGDGGEEGSVGSKSGAGGGGDKARINAAVAEMCVRIHTSVEALAETYYQELRRRCVGMLGYFVGIIIVCFPSFVCLTLPPPFLPPHTLTLLSGTM